MAQTTEATCLLHSGAIYPRRIGLRTTHGDDLFAGVKPGGVSIYFGDAPIFHFDLEGRWQRAFMEGVHYLKGLDTSVRSVDREREAGSLVLLRQTLPFGRAVDLDASIRQMALTLIDDLDANRLEILEPPARAILLTAEEFRGFLERVAAWDSTAWFAHRERYLGTYGPIPFLPPDAPNALILQATLGHARGLAFGRARPAEPYVRSLSEFEEHVLTVTRLVGRRIGQYRGIFLGGSDFLQRPAAELLEILEMIGRVFPLGSTKTSSGATWDDFAVDLGQIHTFLDEFSGTLPDRETWQALKERHLGRVTLGIESGSYAIRQTFGRSWQNPDLQAVVAHLKEAEIGIGLVVILGSGGRSSADDHLEATSQLLESLELRSTDLITLVDAQSLDPSPADDLESLSTEEISGQVAALKSRLRESRPSKGPKVVVYNPDKQSPG